MSSGCRSLRCACCRLLLYISADVYPNLEMCASATEDRSAFFCFQETENQTGLTWLWLPGCSLLIPWMASSLWIYSWALFFIFLFHNWGSGEGICGQKSCRKSSWDQAVNQRCLVSPFLLPLPLVLFQQRLDGLWKNGTGVSGGQRWTAAALPQLQSLGGRGGHKSNTS